MLVKHYNTNEAPRITCTRIEQGGELMLLKDKNAVIYGAGGHIGSAVARDGASVFLAGRTQSALDAVAEEIHAAGGAAEAAQVDALDPQAIEQHLGAIVSKAGRIDISFNAISIRDDLQGTPLIQMLWEDVTTPVLTGIKTHFLTAIAAARHMVQQRSGVILTLSSSAAVLSGRDRRYHLAGGFATACAAIEALSRSLAGELGPQGIRVVCLRPDAIPETWSVEPGGDINASGVKPYMEDGTVLGRLPTLNEVANAAAFMASDRASAMTGAIANLTCGSIMD
jgi:3-oxoacyl-[acyl-carrier protein] reductase